MLPHITFHALGAALCLLPLTAAHMQMLIPSPFRDPHSNRNEPKDYNILTPLHADGSDFACKGYQWNTPWTTVATYEAGKSYKMTLKGSATHGGGSCQLSLSCDGGIKFKVIKSMVGGCPLQSQYPFTIPEEFARTDRATCLFAWTWFNKIGNREMYMNCAVVDIVPRKSRSGRPFHARNSQTLNPRGIARANAAAQTALAGYPDLFVANLKKVNGCVVKETMNVVFDEPGQSVAFGDGAKNTASPSFKRGVCTGSGLRSVDSSAFSSTSSTGGWKDSSNSGGKDWTWQGGDQSSQSTGQSHGDDGQWHGGKQASQSTSGDDGQWHGDKQASQSTSGDDGQWHGDKQASQSTSGDDGQWHGGQTSLQNQQAQASSNLRPVDISQVGQQPDANVQSQLQAYLAKLYGKGASSRKRNAEVVDVELGQRGTERIESHNGNEDYTEHGGQEEEVHDAFENQAYANHHSDESDYGLNEDPLYRSTYPRLPRTTRQKRWALYNQRRASPSIINNEATSNTDQAATAAHAPASPNNDDPSYKLILEKLNSLGDTLFTLFKFARTHLDDPPPGRYIFGPDSAAGNNNTKKAVQKRDPAAPAAPAPAGQPISWSTILADLNKIQRKVSSLVQFVENKVSTSNLPWQRMKRSFVPQVFKRQLIIPGIIPATVQNKESFYFPAPTDVPGDRGTAKPKTSTGSEASRELPAKVATSSLGQGDGIPEPGAAEALFPDIGHETMDNSPQESKTTKPYDWARIYPDLEKSASAKMPAVVSPTPLAKLLTTGEHGSGNGRLPPVVGPTPFSDWDKVAGVDAVSTSGREPPSVQSDNGAKWVGEEVYHKPEQQDVPHENTSHPSPTAPPPLNATNVTNVTYTPANSTQALGEALKQAFPKLAQTPTNEPTDKPPVQSPDSSTDIWHDGVFPGFQRGHTTPSTTTTPTSAPTPTPTPTPSIDSAKAADKKALAALLPYLLAPGPVRPSNFPLDNNNNNNNNHPPDNLETMPHVTNDLGPQDEARIRKFFDDLRNEASAAATAQPTPAVAHGGLTI